MTTADGLVWVFLIALALLAGLIDSLAGGGGLITVPGFFILMGPGPEAIGTNKILAVTASGAALLAYWKNAQIEARLIGIALIATGLGAFSGARVAPHLPNEFFRWLVIALAPAMMWLVLNKDVWQSRWVDTEPRPSPLTTLWQAGVGVFFAGFYDGLAGPGGGTLMFLALYFLGRAPLPMAIGTSKLANLASALVSLGTYEIQGLVRWDIGWLGALPIGAGAFIGASWIARLGRGQRPEASMRLQKLARQALFVIAGLMLLRLAFDLGEQALPIFTDRD